MLSLRASVRVRLKQAKTSGDCKGAEPVLSWSKGAGDWGSPPEALRERAGGKAALVTRNRCAGLAIRDAGYSLSLRASHARRSGPMSGRFSASWIDDLTMPKGVPASRYSPSYSRA